MYNQPFNTKKLLENLIPQISSQQFPPYKGDYPLQMAMTAERRSGATLVFSVEDHLSIPEMGNNRMPPLKDGNLSRFVLIINDGKLAVKANLPQYEVHALVNRCRACVQSKIMRDALGMTQPDTSSDVKLFLIPEFKGKSPEEILLAGPDNEKYIHNAIQTLQANIANPQYARYAERNQKTIDACYAALQKLHDGTLAPRGASCIPVYEGEWKNTGKIENGISKIYKLDIRYYMSGKSPWEIVISESEAPLEKKANNSQIIRLGQMSEPVVRSVHMGHAWENIVEKMGAEVTAFDNSVYAFRRMYAERNTYFEKQNQVQSQPVPAQNTQPVCQNPAEQPRYTGYYQPYPYTQQ